MSVLYLLHQLVENYAENLELLRNVDWVVVPVVNPDGFVYTFTNVSFVVFGRIRFRKWKFTLNVIDKHNLKYEKQVHSNVVQLQSALNELLLKQMTLSNKCI